MSCFFASFKLFSCLRKGHNPDVTHLPTLREKVGKRERERQKRREEKSIDKWIHLQERLVRSQISPCDARQAFMRC